MIKVQKSKLIKIIRDDRQIHLRSNTHGCELIIYRSYKNFNKTTFENELKEQLSNMKDITYKNFENIFLKNTRTSCSLKKENSKS